MVDNTTNRRLACRLAEGDARASVESNHKKANGNAQALVVVSPRSVSSSWTTRPVPSSETSRDPVCLKSCDGCIVTLLTDLFAQSVRTTSFACSSPNVRPDVCDKFRRLEWRKRKQMVEVLNGVNGYGSFSFGCVPTGHYGLL